MVSSNGRVRWGLAALVALAVAGCATTTAHRPASAPAIERLLRLVQARLDVAPAVARNKWNSRAPIEDVAREAQVITAVVAQAAGFGVAEPLAASFFRAQIEASKVVQRSLHAEWAARRQGRFSTVADLERDIRPVLDRLTPELLGALAAAVPALRDPHGRAWLDRHSSSLATSMPGGREAVRTALAPLVTIATGAVATAAMAPGADAPSQGRTLPAAGASGPTMP